jgi:protein-S-isoprenylcysteine O-methyltransferase Ste14
MQYFSCLRRYVMTERKRRPPLLPLIFGAILLLIIPVLLMSAAGDWRWVEGWIFSLWYLGLSYTAVFSTYWRDPELLAERGADDDISNRPIWDRRWGVIAFLGFFIWLIVMPLESRRFEWTPGFQTWVKIIGGSGLVPSAYLILKTYFTNTYLSRVVRVQEERGQEVITTGVYRFVRHPMYLGASLFFICGPLLMESFFGIGIGCIMILLLAYRIMGEERLLVEQLKGYAEYREKTKYRLLPGIW